MSFRTVRQGDIIYAVERGIPRDNGARKLLVNHNLKLLVNQNSTNILESTFQLFKIKANIYDKFC